jgi:osmoprotectant transport system permease protein
VRRRISKILIICWSVAILFITPIVTTLIKSFNSYDIVIGAKDFSESEILSEVQKSMINKYYPEIKVKTKYAISSARSSLLINHGKGVISSISEYTGTVFSNFWVDVPQGFKREEILKWDISDFSDNKNSSDSTKNITFIYNNDDEIKGLGFNNGYELVVNNNNSAIKEYDDFKSLINYKGKIAMDSSFASSEIGLGALFDIYKNNPLGTTSGERAKKEFENLGWEVVLVDTQSNRYEYLKNQTVDISIGYTTDPQLSDPNTFKRLGHENVNGEWIKEEDKFDELSNFFPTYFSSIIIREDILDKFNYKSKINPSITSLEKCLSLIRINSSDMLNMNKQVFYDKKEPKNVAKEFLESLNYFIK